MRDSLSLVSPRGNVWIIITTMCDFRKLCGDFMDNIDSRHEKTSRRSTCTFTSNSS